MPGEQTPEEVQNQYIELMGPELGAAYDVLRHDVTLVFANWSLYKQLYAQPDRLRVLADVAGNLFGLLRHTVFRDIVLQLARLVDRPDTDGKTNLTLQSLPSSVSDGELRLALATTGEPLLNVTLGDIDNALHAFADLLDRLESHFNHAANTAHEWVEVRRVDSLFYFLEGGLDAERRDAWLS